MVMFGRGWTGLSLFSFLLLSPAWGQQWPPKPPVKWIPAHWANYLDDTLDRGIWYVVIHSSEGGNCGHGWFQNPYSSVSAHYGVESDGTIHQMVSDQNKAWHAGNSYYNKHSIGIEHAGYAYMTQWGDAQMKASAKLTRWICLTYGIPMDRTHIIGHVEVPGSTHTDPGPNWDWSYYLWLVKGGDDLLPLWAPSGSPLRKAFEVTASALRVRKGPGLEYPIDGLVADGQKYVSRATYGGWIKINYKGNTGWSYGGYLKPVSNVVAVSSTVGTSKIRGGPSPYTEMKGVIHTGEAYVKIQSLGDWLEIFYGGGSAWIYGPFSATSLLK
jgi:uncharacterized protein YraI